ncbi:MAG TPA: tRNA lysidine(34) synthetase TilS [Mycobacteriales bacterium]|nr:tRNA lysidine(34) synthetase TilS [Mycobacteriales bacterium]
MGASAVPKRSPSKDPAVAQTRRAVRRLLEVHVAAGDIGPGALVFAAVSGGADSLALAAALAWVGPKLGLDAGALTVDHGLQPGSAERADAVAKQCVDLGLAPVFSVTASILDTGQGPEAAAREARYDALTAVASREEASAIATGHTLDDQAETVLLGLARGSGPRSLAGMAEQSTLRGGLLLRPFLGVTRATTHAACAALGLQPWDDPHNHDRRFARVRVRLEALPALEAALGPGVTAALARTAGLLRDDADALDAWADDVAAGDLSVPRLAALPAAVRTRVLRRAVLAAGAPAGAVTAAHVADVERLVVDWHGQAAVSLPGGLVAERRCDRLSFR